MSDEPAPPAARNTTARANDSSQRHEHRRHPDHDDPDRHRQPFAETIDGRPGHQVERQTG